MQGSTPIDPGSLSQLYLLRAIPSLIAAEASETCPYCRTHIREARVAVEDMAELAGLMHDMKRHPGMANAVRHLAASAESTGVLALLARVFRRIRVGR